MRGTSQVVERRGAELRQDCTKLILVERLVQLEPTVREVHSQLQAKRGEERG